MSEWKPPLAFLFCAAMTCAPLGAFEYRFTRGLETPPLHQVELLSCQLDEDVFQATRDGMPDLRLIDGRGDSVPFLLRKQRTSATGEARHAWAAVRPDAKPLDGGGLEVIFSLSDDDPRPNGLRIVTPLRDFEHRVRVFVSNESDAWEPLVDDEVLFDYSRYIDVRRDELRFPETHAQRFRVVIDDVTSEQQSQLLALTRRLRGQDETGREERVTVMRRPFRIDRIQFLRITEREVSTGDLKRTYEVSGFRVEEDAPNSRTFVYVETHKQPITSFRLQADDSNFSRAVAVEAKKPRGATTEWVCLSRRTLSRIDFRNVQEERLDASLLESRYPTYRLAIDNRDSPPLKITGVTARGNVYEMLFLASPGDGYRLIYGSDDARPANHDTAAVTKLLEQGFQPLPVQLGVPSPGIGQSDPWSWAKLLNNRLLLAAMILLLVVLLARGLWSAVKRLDDLPSG